MKIFGIRLHSEMKLRWIFTLISDNLSEGPEDNEINYVTRGKQ